MGANSLGLAGCTHCGRRCRSIWVPPTSWLSFNLLFKTDPYIDTHFIGDVMFFELKVGNLHEPISGRSWEQERIYEEFWHRVRLLQIHGVSRLDRVLIHYGNNLEFFVDLLAIWYLGGSAIPIDSRLTPFEVENIARVAKPGFSLWGELVDEPVAGVLRGLGVKIVQACNSENNHSHAFASPPPKSEFSLDQGLSFCSPRVPRGNPRELCTHIAPCVRAG